MSTPLTNHEDVFNIRSDENDFDDHAPDDQGQADAQVAHVNQSPTPRPLSRQNPAVKKPKAGLTPVANASHEFIVNFGRGKTDNCPIARTLTWDELIKQFTVPDTKRGKLPLAQYLRLNKKIKTERALRDAEKNGPYFIMAAFSKPGTRDAVDVGYMTGFVGDIDTGNISKEELQAKLVGFQYIVYSSYSHSPDMPMWRFVLLYARPVTAAEHAKAYAFLQKAFDGQLDKHCAILNQLWYTSACPPDAGQYYEFFTGTGDLLNPDLLPDVVPTNASTSTALVTAPAPTLNLSVDEFNRLFILMGYINADDRHIWITVGMALKNKFGDAALTLWLKWSRSSSKYDEDDAESTWDSLHPLEEGGVTLGTIYHLAKQGGWNSAMVGSEGTGEAIALSPLFDIKEANVHRFLVADAPPRRWLLHHTLPLGKVGMLVAPGGTGKSFFSIQLAVAVATKTRMAGHWDVDEAGSSLILCAEEDDDDLHHRLRDVMAATVGSSPAMQQLVEQRVHIKSMLAENNLMTHANDKREIVPTDYVDRLILTAKQIPDLKLIVIDPASRFRGGDEIAAQDTTRFVEVLERLRSATGATVLLVHHTNKGSMGAEEAASSAARGSSALTDGVRWQMNLGKPNKAQAKLLGMDGMNRDAFVLATITKNNGAPPQPPLLLMRGAGGVLEVARYSASQHSPERKLLALIETEAAAGKTYTANSLEAKFSGVNGPLGISAAALRKLVTGCLGMKYLRKRTDKPVGTLETTGTGPA